MKKKLLLALADKLCTVGNEDYNPTDYHKDALFWAAHVLVIKKAGLKLVERANEPGGMHVQYKNKVELDAAAALFDIEPVHAQYLFSDKEYDLWGYQHKAPFDTKKDGGYSRDMEGPVWAAERIRVFVRDSSVDYLARAA
jgi:hypothetical protein